MCQNGKTKHAQFLSNMLANKGLEMHTTAIVHFHWDVAPTSQTGLLGYHTCLAGWDSVGLQGPAVDRVCVIVVRHETIKRVQKWVEKGLSGTAWDELSTSYPKDISASQEPLIWFICGCKQSRYF